MNKADEISDFLELTKLHYVRHCTYLQRKLTHKTTGVCMIQANIELMFGKMNDIFYYCYKK